MKKTLCLLLLAGVAVTASAQMTPEQVSQKMRPEYQVDLSTCGNKKVATSSANANGLDKNELQQEIAYLQAQNTKIDQAAADYQQQFSAANQQNDVTMRKYAQARAYNQELLERKQYLLTKLSKG